MIVHLGSYYKLPNHTMHVEFLTTLDFYMQNKPNMTSEFRTLNEFFSHYDLIRDLIGECIVI